jgi:D-sedoheptulose 7-phosphate isomerase
MEFFGDYFEQIRQCLGKVHVRELERAADLIHTTRSLGRKVIIVGNGGSAAMASHVAVDLTKVAGVRAINFNEADLLTCFANDYGYEHWVEKALDFYSDEGDLVIVISSSGRSQNIINGAKRALELKLNLITLSGFSANNPLSALGQVSLWADSSSYNIVEMTHHIWLVAIVDYLDGRSEERGKR